jgi:hypothetical protein
MNELFSLIFPEVCQSRRLCIFTLPNKRSRLFESVEDAAEYAEALPSSLNVYHCVSLIAGNPSGRGTKEETAAVSTVWCDIDVAGEAHKSDRLPKTKEEAVQLVDSLPIKPSVIVDSGHGIHAYWPFEQSLILDSEEQRDSAERLTKAWHQLACDEAAKHGWSLENLGDIPRVLRTPGTLNNKVANDRRPITIIRNTGELFPVNTLVAHVDKPTRPEAATVEHKASTNGNGYSPLSRCLKYLEKIPAAVQGQKGGTQTLMACRAIFRFGLDGDAARSAFDAYNARCNPPWENEKEINHKLSDARRIVSRDNEFGKWAEVGSESAYSGPDVELSQLLANLQKQPEPEKSDAPNSPDKFPEDCLKPPGLLAEIINHNLQTALFPQPELALAGALALLGTITGRKVQDYRRTRTNVYCLGLAASGSGKEHARSVNKEILLRSGDNGRKMIGPEGVASSAGMVAFIQTQPAILFQLDEIGRLLETMRDPRRAPHLFKIGSVLMQLESNSHCIWVGDAYANQKQTPTINQPHACLYGTSVPRGFWESLTEDNVSEGLLGRMMVFEAGSRYVAINTPERAEPPASIIDPVRWWCDYQPGGNLANESTGGTQPIAAVYKPDAAKRIDGHMAEICRRRDKEDDTRAALWSRTTGKTAKLALLLACSREIVGPAIAITLEDVERAIKISNWLTRRMLYQAYRHVARNEREGNHKKVLRLLSSNKMTKTQLTRATRWLSRRERDEIVSDLIDGGEVRIVEEKGSTKPVTYLETIA